VTDIPLTPRPASGQPATPPPGAVPVTVRRGLGDDAAQGNFWQQIGGRPTFEVLWPMYPEADLEGAIQRLTGFLEQYWGGPTTYSQERGHPRLRMRHMPFRVTPEARDHWLQHMRVAVDELELAPLDDAMLWGYLDRAAQAMVNTFER
jgi:hemoglobin